MKIGIGIGIGKKNIGIVSLLRCSIWYAKK